MKMRGGDRTVGVEDLAEARDFFVGALGLKVLSDKPAQLVLDVGAKLTVLQSEAGGKVELETAGLADLVEALDDKGFYADGPKETPNGAYADVEGPEGVEVVIWEAQ
jgi:catechol 2,3-dioxygenase-like lactoylglutathione lyase family enzyme